MRKNAPLISPEEFGQLREPWDPKMRALAEERIRTNYSRDQLEHFSLEEAVVMRAVLARLIPQGEGIDLVGFIDGRLWDSIGRGDRRPGMPEEKEVIKTGLRGLTEAARALHQKEFHELTASEQDAILKQVQKGDAPGAAWDRVPGEYFFNRFYARALTGYFSHPLAWMRIGFYGASYPEGYTWLGQGQVKQRQERAPGWDRL